MPRLFAYKANAESGKCLGEVREDVACRYLSPFDYLYQIAEPLFKEKRVLDSGFLGPDWLAIHLDAQLSCERETFQAGYYVLANVKDLEEVAKDILS